MTSYLKRLGRPLDSSPPYTDTNNNSDNDKATRGDKYSLRPRSMRRRNNINEDSSESVLSSSCKSRNQKTKQKAAPLINTAVKRRTQGEEQNEGNQPGIRDVEKSGTANIRNATPERKINEKSRL
ncbi:hypothetical protein NQ317_016057 [Molorchus minor]|uniref:Uncharacterized protein n=1 Tax=Molorchus minor TaxID=1323400 RepID=A0ABQ9IZW4_9CUCU|nr:hypothetical protein NQ317_016057 [Molorchus minor]